MLEQRSREGERFSTDVLPQHRDRRERKFPGQQSERLSSSADVSDVPDGTTARGKTELAVDSPGDGRLPRGPRLVAKNAIVAAVTSNARTDAAAPMERNPKKEELSRKRRQRGDSPRAGRDEGCSAVPRAQKTLKRSDSFTRVPQGLVEAASEDGREPSSEGRQKSADTEPRRTLFVNRSRLASMLAQNARSRDRLDKADSEKAEKALKELEKRLNMSNVVS